jgi:hypothetical protein
LTENHVPPEAVGNHNQWIARSYLAASTANQDLVYGRKFRGGVRFRTLCQDCNNGLGGREDKAIVDFFSRVRKLVESPIILSPIIRVPAKPNLIFRGLLAHLVSANDSGVPSAFDSEAREIFFKRRSLNLSSLSLFYWIYVGDELFLMRNAYSTVWHPTIKLTPIHILKIFPLAFMFVQEAQFLGLSNMRSFLCSKDDDEVDVPIQLYRYEANPVWPAMPENNRIIFLAGDSFGLVGKKN